MLTADRADASTVRRERYDLIATVAMTSATLQISANKQPAAVRDSFGKLQTIDRAPIAPDSTADDAHFKSGFIGKQNPEQMVHRSNAGEMRIKGRRFDESDVLFGYFRR